MRRWWLLAFLFSLPVFAQVNNPDLLYVTTAPSGACSGVTIARVVVTSGSMWTCQNGSWGVVGPGAPGSPGVTSVNWAQGGYPSWLVGSVQGPTSDVLLSIHPATAQADNQVIGTCGTGSGAAGFAPCTITAPMLPMFSSSGAGIVPTSPGGTVGYLRADGQWTAPPGTSGGTVTSVGINTLPDWLVGNVTDPSTDAVINVSARSGQTTSQVIGTCNGSTTFGPCYLTADQLPLATDNSVGGVKPDETTTRAIAPGVISVAPGVFAPLPTATGIPHFNGTIWDSAYGTSGTGTTLALTASPTFTGNMGFANATGATVTANSYVGQFSPIYGTFVLGSGSGGTLEKTVSDATSVLVLSQNTATTGTGDYLDVKDSSGTVHQVIDHSLDLYGPSLALGYTGTLPAPWPFTLGTTGQFHSDADGNVRASTFNGVGLTTGGSTSSCLSAAGTYVPCANGSGNVSTTGLTSGFIPSASGTNSIGNSHLDDGVTQSGALTYANTNGFAVRGSNQNAMLSVYQTNSASAGTPLVPAGSISMIGQCWNGSASQNDQWSIQQLPNGASSSASRLLLINSSACSTGGEFDFMLAQDGTKFTTNNTRISDANGLETDSGLDGLKGTVTGVAGTGAGSTAGVVLIGDRHAGSITVTTGTSTAPVANGTIITVTFNPAYSGNAFCTFSPTPTTLSLTGGSLVGIFSASPTTFQLVSGATALEIGANYQWTYNCNN